jgi:hydrogenase maturation protease
VVEEFGIVVVGFGSPHGDDRAGWEVVERLDRRSEGWRESSRSAAQSLRVASKRARVVRVREGTQLIQELEGRRRLIVVDACRSGGPVGTISRFCWPDPRIRAHHDRSTHEIGLCSALELAEQLGKLPQYVEVFGIEIGDLEPIGGMSAEVLQAVETLAAVIFSEIDEAVHA